MKVCFINSVCGQGSTGKICCDLAGQLALNSHSYLIVYGRGHAPKGINSFKMNNPLGNDLDGAASRLLDNQGFNSFFQTKKLIRKIEEYKPDIIHLHNLHGYYLNLPLLFKYLAEDYSGKVVWTLHDCWPFTGHCCHFDRAGCLKWKNGCFDCPLRHSYPKSFSSHSEKNYSLKKRIFLSVNSSKMFIIAPSQWLLDLVHLSFLSKFPSMVIRNGVDTKIFTPSGSKSSNPKIILGVANVWSENKGLSDFLHLRHLLGPEFLLKLVGLSPKQISALPSGIQGLPKITSSQGIAKLYSEASFFFNPTHEDNYPTTNLEAFACGTKTVTYPVGGSSECILTKDFVVTSPEEFAEKIKTLEIMEEKMVDISLETFYHSYLGLYEKLAS